MSTKLKTTEKAAILQDRLDAIKAKLPADKAEALQGAVEAMNEMVNLIEHSGRIKTTQDWYGDYLPLIKTQQDAVLYRLAGAGNGPIHVAKINGWV